MGFAVLFCGILDPAAVQDCTKFQSVMSNLLLQSGPALADAGPNARPGCWAQCKTWARGPMQDLSTGPLWAVILWHHCVQSTVILSW